MIKALLTFVLTRRAIIVTGTLVFIAGGLAAFWNLNIEAYPNPAPVILEITAQAPGLSAEEMEKYYTIPIEVGLYPTPGIDTIRSTSFYGLSFVRVTFKYGIDYYFAYTQAALSLQQNVSLPGSLVPTIQQSSLVGEIFRYQIVGPPHFGLTNLRTIQDWVVTRRLMAIPGVVAINSWGGTTKQFDVDADLQKLEAFNITVPQLVTAIGNANINVGAREITIGQQSVNIRGVGLIDDGGADVIINGYKVDDIENIVLTQSNGVPVLVKDIAKVSVGYVPRLGIAGRDHDDDIAAAIVVMSRTQHTIAVLPLVRAGVRKNKFGWDPTPGSQSHSLLRPQFARFGHHPHGPAQPRVRLHPRFLHPVAFPGRFAQRHRRQREYSVRSVFRHYPPRNPRRGCKPPVTGCGRLRNHRRFGGDLSREYFSKFPGEKV